MITVKAIEEALRKTGGFVSYAAKQLGCTQSNVTQRIQKNKKLQAVQEEISCQYLDLSEHSLMKKVKDGELGAICFYLKCKGKHRGYVERQEITGADGGPVESIKLSAKEYKKARKEMLDDDEC